MKLQLFSVVALAPAFVSSFTPMATLHPVRVGGGGGEGGTTTTLHASDNSAAASGGGGEPPMVLDVSDLGLTMADLQKPIPTDALSLESSGYQSTSRLPSVDDEGCYWVENADDLDITLRIPGLRGQPAACLSVLFSTTTISVTAFGRVVWSCIQMGISDPDDCSFLTEDGEGMVPVVQLNIKKRDEGERWGGYILQVGEDSIL